MQPPKVLGIVIIVLLHAISKICARSHDREFVQDLLHSLCFCLDGVWEEKQIKAPIGSMESIRQQALEYTS
jgi:hypothetical protein